MTKLYPPKIFYCQNPFFAPDKNNVMEMKSLFEKAVAESISINVNSGNETALKLYSLFKQATKGDIDIEPLGSSFDDDTKAKYDAWAALKGKSIRDAQCEYVLLVHELKN